MHVLKLNLQISLTTIDTISILTFLTLMIKQWTKRYYCISDLSVTSQSINYQFLLSHVHILMS